MNTLSVWEHEYLELPLHELYAIHKVTDQKLEILLNEKDESNLLLLSWTKEGIAISQNDIYNCNNAK